MPAPRSDDWEVEDDTIDVFEARVIALNAAAIVGREPHAVIRAADLYYAWLFADD